MLLLLGAARGVFLSMALLASPLGNRGANRYLAGYVLVFTAMLFDNHLEAAGVLDRNE